MKKILYICTKNQYDWDTLIPPQVSPSEESDISVLLLQHGLELRNLPPSQVFTLKTEERARNNSGICETISYLEFLEKIFIADLALVL
jgi:hypothetical protein